MILPSADENEIKSRLDLIVMQKYNADPSVARITRGRILDTWRTDSQLSKLSLSSINGLENITDSEDDRAVRNICDYWFEPLVLPSMNLGQIEDYYLGVRQSMQLEITDSSAFSADSPMVLEALHHCCIFSVIFVFIKKMIEETGYRKVVLLHLSPQLDTRLLACGALIEKLPNVQASHVQMTGNWLNSLASEVTNQTILIYMGDMSPSMFPMRRPSRAASSILHLFSNSRLELELKGISIASVLARRFSAAHFLLDFPRSNIVRVRPRREYSELWCPLSDWVFWPCIHRWYSPITQRCIHQGQE